MRLAVVAGIAVSAVAFAAPARADVRFAGDDVRITVDEAGVAHVEHALAYRVTGALPAKGLEVNGVEPEAVLDPVALVALDGEAAGDARVDRKSDRVLHVAIDPLPRHAGSHTTLLALRVRYTVDLVQARELTPDGAMWQIGWTAPAAPEGYDSARVTFDLPGAPTEPRVVAAEGSAEDDGRIVTLRRGPQRDELALERPHVAKGEGASWGAQVDPRAFPRVTDLALRPPAIAPAEPVKDRGTSLWAIAAFAGILFGALVRAKSAAFARACTAASAEGRVVAGSLVESVSPLGRAWLAGGAVAAALVAEGASAPMWGALGIAGAMVLATSRVARVSLAPRGPGHWLALSPGEAFAKGERSDRFDFSQLADVGTSWGKLAMVVAAAASIALGLALGSIDRSWTWLAPLDALALLPLFVTGSRAQLPVNRATAPKRRLAWLHRALKRDGAIRVAPWARVPTGACVPDELRLLVLPRAPMPGVVGIEVGVAWIATPAGYAPETEVLVRVREATAAAARMVALGPKRRVVHGRKIDERVVRLVPALPTRAGVVALVRRLASELRDRRKSLPGAKWPGTERRLPPNERVPESAAVAA